MWHKIVKISSKIHTIGPFRALKVAAHRAKSHFLINFWRQKAYAGTAGCSWESLPYYKEGVLPSFLAGPVKLPDLSTINWHRHGDHQFDAATFYKDISIVVFQDSGPDIKVPWELSRFQYLIAVDDPKLFMACIENWLDHNPYMIGINWLCPMEVGIRVINWLLAWQRLKGVCSEGFKRRFICSVYDHMIYLENNWELSDGRTSNHYLSDLVGYFYTACFFEDCCRQQWAFQEIANEMQWQVFDEGTSYEGSTAYHGLVTELFHHAKLLAELHGIAIPDFFKTKLERMQQFIVDYQGVKIGDDDSGIIVNGIVPLPEKRFGLFEYKQFGLSIINTHDFHITLRHAVYNQKQPTGHFHADAASITFSYKGIPILIDPGSFAYTGSEKWRNYFRSIKNHNSFFLKDIEPFNFDDMFLMNISSSEYEGVAIETSGKYTISTHHRWYERYGLTFHRKLECDRLKKIVTISDSWSGNCEQDLITETRFIFAPEIELEKNNHTWIIKKNGVPLLIFSSNLDFVKEIGWVAPRYETKENTIILCANKKLSKKTHCIFFESI